jgi:hypothetical protein
MFDPNKKPKCKTSVLISVLKVGIEPTLPKELDFESIILYNSTLSALQ